MRLPILMTLCAAPLLLVPAPPAAAESYQSYLSRMRDICAAECLPPREFQRAARRSSRDAEADMAVIMDVRAVRRMGDKFQLLSMDVNGPSLLDQAVLASAGINASSSNGIGGLPRGRTGGTDPNLIIIEIDEEAFFGVLNSATPLTQNSGTTNPSDGADNSGTIIVEGDAERELIQPSLAQLRSYFRGRRVVVRGTPRLEAVLIGARRDFRRKQVTLEVDNADDIVLLPRFDSDGEPILSE